MTAPEGLACPRADLAPADADARRPAVVGERHPAKIRRDQLEAHRPADVVRVKQRGIEIGVVADVDRDLEDRVLPQNQTRSHGVAPSRRSAFLQEIEQAVAQSSPGGGPEPE